MGGECRGEKKGKKRKECSQRTQEGGGKVNRAGHRSVGRVLAGQQGDPNLSPSTHIATWPVSLALVLGR